MVQPLTPTQISGYLKTSGDELSAIHSMLQHDAELQEMANTPLLLSIMTLAFQGVSSTGLFDGSHLIRRQYLFDAYIRRMFVHRGVPVSYAACSTMKWLRWLAFGLKEDGQTLFLIERIQPNRFQIYNNYVSYSRIMKLIGGVVYGLVLGIMLWMMGGIVWGLVGVLSGLTIGQYSKPSFIVPVEKLVLSKIWTKEVAFVTVLFGVLMGFNARFNTDSNLVLTLFFSIIGGLIGGSGAILSYIDKSDSITEHSTPNQGMWHSSQNMLVGSLVSAPHFGLMFGMACGVYGELHVGFAGGLATGLIGGLFKYGGETCLQHLVLRYLFYRYKLAPWNYARFLDYCHERLFLRKVGGGYIFIHRMLMEHFANMTDEDIERIAREVEASR